MRRLLVSLCLVCGIVLSLSGLVSAQTAPTFKLGFLALAQQIPDVVGEPLENEHWGANGDSLQQTTKGLMVWRKADNWTAFTDGARTWINGPLGVQDRPNNMRYDWERDLVSPAPTSVLTPRPPEPIPTSLSPTATAVPADPVVWNLDKPTNGAVVAGIAEVSGWAFDRGGEHLAWNAIDDVQVYLDAPMGSGGCRVDTGRTNSVRTDVGASFGKPVYSNSGFSTTVPLAGVAPGTHSLYIHVRSQLSGWRYKRVDVVVSQAVVGREKLEQAMLKLSDLPAVYRTIENGWSGDDRMWATYRADDPLRNPSVLVSLYLRGSPASAQSSFDNFSHPYHNNMNGYLMTATPPLGQVSASRGYVKNYVTGDKPSTSNIVYFVRDNVLGIVSCIGLASFTHINQAVHYAQIMVNRLVAP